MPFQKTSPFDLKEALFRLEESEKQLRVVSSRYEAILASVPDIIMEVNNDKVYTWANQAGLDFFGEDVIGREASYYFEGEQETYSIVAPLFDGTDDLLRVDSWQRRKDGVKRLLTWRCRSLKDIDGRVIGALSSARDITDIQATLEALEQSERRLMNLYSNMREGVALHTLEFGREGNPVNYRIVGINRQFENILGLKEKDVVGQLSTVVYSTPEPPFLSEFASVAMSGNPQQFELFFEPMERYFSISVSPWEKNGFATIFTDITSRKQTEEALKESESKFRSVAQCSPMGIMIYQGDYWVYTNPAGEEITGFSAGELYKMKFWEIIAEPFREETIKNGRRRQAGKIGKISYEIQLILKSGNLKWVYLTGTNITYGGKPAGMISVVDISARKQLELTLNEALEKSRESDRLKSAFLANMSHEIRTPMNAILGFTELISDPSSTDEDKKRFSSVVKNAGNRLLHLINDIIDISKLEARQIVLNTEYCNAREILNSTAESFRNSLSLKNKNEISILIDLNDLPAGGRFSTDIVRLQQIIDNLVSNAIKYTESGSIILGANLHEEDNARYMKFFVQDTGKGIPREKHTMIFERFRQAEEHEFREGAGLGLSISKGLVELLGGRIWVESEPGKGSMFCFIIPYKQESQHTETPAIKPSMLIPDLRGKTVIIAEDDRDSYEYIHILLEGTGAILLRTENGNELLEMLQARQPDLLLLDIRMPGKTGIQCLDIIREKGYSLRIIAQTAYAMAEEKQEVLAAGCHGYIAKPFTKKDLFECISEVLSLQ